MSLTEAQSSQRTQRVQFNQLTLVKKLKNFENSARSSDPDPSPRETGEREYLSQSPHSSQRKNKVYLLLRAAQRKNYSVFSVSSSEQSERARGMPLRELCREKNIFRLPGSACLQLFEAVATQQ